MKIPKEFYRSLAELKATIPKLVDHTLAVIFVNENEAKFFSFEGKDQEAYSVFRQEDEGEADFYRRAKAQAHEKFPKSEMVIMSHEEYSAETPESDPDMETSPFRQSETSRRYSEKIRKDISEHRARRVKSQA